MDVAILLYDGVTAAEALGPFEVFGKVPGVDVHFVAERPGPHITQGKPGLLVADRSLAEWTHPDTLIVPGGLGVRRLLEDPRLIAWIAEAHRSTQWTAGVSTGAMLLGAAGALDGCDATSHWLVLDELTGVGAVPSHERLVRHGRVVTASGPTSAFDLGLLIVERSFGAEAADRVRRALLADPDGTRRSVGIRRFLPWSAGPPPSSGTYVTTHDSPRRRWGRRESAPRGQVLATGLSPA